MNRITSVCTASSARRWIGLAVSLLVLSGLWSCSTQPGAYGKSSGQADLITDSDEPENRKRARIRMELAVGYFEQGQTRIALDEVKLALLADPLFADAHNLRGLVYMRMNELPLAQDSFQRSLALDPKNMNVVHNLGWLQCQQARFVQAVESFGRALADPTYTGRAKTWLTQGLCQMRAGELSQAESSLSRSYELDPGNPITGYNLSQLLYRRGELVRAQFQVQRINNSELANAESLWLGIKVERRLQNLVVVQQLVDQLKKRFPQSAELIAYERGQFDD
ncbi:MAG: type IV pilus biogenesis/stability protein PilW [Burkholderiaceae bacterium]